MSKKVGVRSLAFMGGEGGKDNEGFMDKTRLIWGKKKKRKRKISRKKE